MKNHLFKTPLILFCLAAISACDNKNPKPSDPPQNANELITSFLIRLEDSATNQTQFIRFSDPDGDGGQAPTQFDSIRLNKNSTYFAQLILLDESKTPADTVSIEIKEEGKDHLLVYTVSTADLQIHITDTDENLLPLGLESIWRTGSVGTGQLRIVLKHQPGIKTGNPDLGETDIDLLFQVMIN